MELTAPPSTPGPPMQPRGLIPLLTFTAGITVANLYYSQPLLLFFAQTFQVDPARTSIVTAASQLGYAAGLLLLVPLGDTVDRRRLIVGTTLAIVAALIAVALAPNLPFLTAVSFLLGAATIVPQLVVPFAASIATPAARGRVVGNVMSGLLIGILLSRFISGLAAPVVGWRGLYWVAAALMALLAVALRWQLPRQLPEHATPYAQLLRSLGSLVRREPLLRRHALVGGLGFGAFSAFWTTLVFHLASLPGHYGSRMVGLFGLIGAVGALVAPLVGRLADRFEARVLNGAALGLVVAAYGLLAFTGHTLLGLAVGVILLDAGVQASHISNQTRIFALDASARNRLNAVYMVTYFLGGAAGSAVGASAWHRFGWPGVVCTGIVFALAGIIALFTIGRPRVHGSVT